MRRSTRAPYAVAQSAPRPRPRERERERGCAQPRAPAVAERRTHAPPRAMDASYVGLRVRVQVDAVASAPSTLDGTVFTYEPRNNLLVLCALSDGDVRRHAVHVLRASRVRDVQLLDGALPPPAVAATTSARPSGGGGADPHWGRLYSPRRPLPALDFEKLRAREEHAVHAEEAAQRKVGQGVSARAQRIFDALDKTLPCQWRGTDIIVLDAVRVEQPYGAHSVHALEADDGGRATDRVRMVLARELEKAGAARDEAGDGDESGRGGSARGRSVAAPPGPSPT